MHKVLTALLISVAAVVSLVSPAVAVDGQGGTPAQPPIPGARRVDLRDTNGGVSTFYVIPEDSVFATRGGRGRPCSWVQQYDDRLANPPILGGTVRESFNWIFGEESLQWALYALGELPSADSPIPTTGPLSKAQRAFYVWCESDEALIGLITVPGTDPMFDPRRRVDDLWQRVRLDRPVVRAFPPLERWGGLVVRSPAWLAIDARPWKSYVVRDEWRGWNLALVLQPAALAFDTAFTRSGSSAPTTARVWCLSSAQATTVDGVVPARPGELPDYADPVSFSRGCAWVAPGKGSVSVTARVTYRVTLWANGFVEELAPYVWSSAPVTFPTVELHSVNIDPGGSVSR